MKIAIIADVHLRASDLKAGELAFGRACVDAENRGCDTLIVAGDLFDTSMVGGRGASTGSVVKAAKDALSKFSGRKYLLLGNHELAGLGQSHALEVFRGMAGVEVVDRPMITGDKPNTIACLPYIAPSHFYSKHPELSRQEQRELFAELIDGVINTLAANKPHILVYHGNIRGGIANSSGYRIIGNGDEMEVSWEQLLETGATYIACGHFHKRQDGFVGALRQLNFGEEGNPTGYRFIETTAGVDKFIEIPSVRYKTIAAEEYNADIMAAEQWVMDGNKLKVRGASNVIPTTFVAQYPDRIQFELLPPDNVIQMRTDEPFTADDSPVSLLRKWHKQTACKVDIESLVKTYEWLSDGLELFNVGSGSLSKINRIVLNHIAKHKHTDVILRDVGGLVVVDGDNGAGKTTLVEAIMLALYGIAPSYGQNLYGMVEQNYYGDAVVEVWLESHGEEYVIKRTAHITAKTKSQDCTVSKFVNGKLVGVAGGKARQSEAETYIQNLVGDRDLLEKSVFACQNGDDITALDPKDRKDLLGKLLGSDKYEAIAKVVNDNRGKVKNDVAAIASHIALLEGQVAPHYIEQLQGCKDDVNLDIAMKKGDLLGLEQAYSKLVEEIATAKAEADSKKADAKAEECREAREKAQDAVYKSLSARDSAIASKTRKGVIEKDVAVIGNVREKLEIERAIAELRVGELARITTEREAIGEQMKALHDARDTARTEYFSQYAAWQRKRDDALVSFNERKAVAEADKRAAMQMMEAAEMKAKLLDSSDIGCGGKMECVFLKDAQTAKERLPQLEIQLVEYSQALLDIKTWDEYIRLIEIEGEEPIEVEDATAAQIEELKASLPTLSFADNSKLIKALEIDEKNLRYLENELSNIVGRLESMGDVEGNLKAANEKLERVNRALMDALEISDWCEWMNEKIEEMQIELAGIMAQKADVNKAIEELTSLIGTINAKLQQAADTQVKIDEQQAAIETLESSLVVLDSLFAAFSRDGIPQLILDTAIPRLAEITQQLLDESGFSGSVLFQTQKATQSGNVREVLNILGWDKATGDYRDVKQFSGGEGTVFKLAIRLAFGMLQAERSGGAIKVFIADESLGNLKPERALGVLAMFQVLSGMFCQIFLISHHTEVCNAIERKILVSKVNDKESKVEVK